MYLSNKYTKWYNNIISSAQSRNISGYVERHHILPKSLSGTNNKDNIVLLTAREHFICHLLLTKMLTGGNKNKMIYAAWCLCALNSRRKNKINSITYAQIKEQRAELLKASRGSSHHSYGRKTGRTSADFTPEWKQKISESRQGQSSWNKGIPRTAKERANMSAGRLRELAKNDPTYNIRPACRPEKAAKIKESNTGKKWVHNPENPVERRQLNADECDAYLLQGWKPGTGPRKPVAKVECPVCHKLVYPTNLGQWHGDKCGTRMSAEQRLLRSTSGKLARLPKV